MSASSNRPVIVHRVTHFPDPSRMAMSMLQGGHAKPESVWVAVNVNTQMVVGQNSDKDKLLSELAEQKFTVKKILNDWN